MSPPVTIFGVISAADTNEETTAAPTAHVATISAFDRWLLFRTTIFYRRDVHDA
jgi:hypothetical protein